MEFDRRETDIVLIVTRSPQIALETVVRQGHLPRTTRVDGRQVNMSLELGPYYGFDRVGARIWQMIERPRSVDSLCSQVGKEFGLDVDTCLDEVVDFLRQLVRDRLVQIVA